MSESSERFRFVFSTSWARATEVGWGGGPEEFLLTHLGVGCVSPVTRAGWGLAWRSQGVAWLWGGGVGRRESRRDMGGE